MENHPIPQDITGFQFKLIGNMTVRQFAYLAVGIVLGWICFILPVPVLIKLPFALFFGLSGVAFAFLPIEGRSMDLMISNFAKALLNPTQFVYHKTGGQFYSPPPSHVSQSSDQPRQSASSLSGDALKNFLNALPKRPKNKLDEREMVFFQSLANMSNPAQGSPSVTPNAPVPHIFAGTPVSMSKTKPAEEEEPTPALLEYQAPETGQDTALLQKELEQAKLAEASQVAGSVSYQEAHQKVLELEAQLSQTVSEKHELESEILDLHKKLEAQGKTIYTPSVAVPEKEPTKNVRSIPKSMGKSVGIPNAPEYPNLVTGIIKDSRGNPLQNILVEVKDAENNPIRAFKTNALGQFASATPLSNGSYTIEFDDTRGENKFDIIAFTATGEIILPIEVISVDTREELRRSLFS